MVHRVILEINDECNYPSKIGRKVGASSSHILNVTDKLEENKIISKEKVGRKSLLKLTEKGKEIQELLIKLREHEK